MNRQKEWERYFRMLISRSCEHCLFRQQAERVEGMDPEICREYLNEVQRILDAREDTESAPVMVWKFNQAFENFFGSIPSYASIKKTYNDLVLAIEPEIWKKIEEAEDSLEAALLYARIGNYIDFSVMADVDQDAFFRMLERKEGNTLTPEVYAKFQQDLARAKTMLLICDNCGEVVFDKLLIRQLKRQYPDLTVYALMRGEEVSNDATLEDAVYCGLDQEAILLSNGYSVPGTVPDMLPPETAEAFSEADVILAKGQGNYETLSGCGRKIYYLFLCKCELFVRKFQVPPLTGMFIEE